MGLSLKLNLFRDVHHDAVLLALREFHSRRGFELQACEYSNSSYELHEAEDNWVVLAFPMGWNWELWRAAQLFVSQRLCCCGFLIFVYDGDYWGYEFFKNGESIDQFVQVEEYYTGGNWFPGLNTNGNPIQLAKELPDLSPGIIADYLVRNPGWASKIDNNDSESERWKASQILNVPVQPDDEFSRFDQCAVLDFLRYLGVPVALQNRHVKFMTPITTSFRFRKR